MSMPLILLAGGLATRMKPETETVPKSLLPVAGRPFVAWQLEALAKNGVKEVALCVGYLGEMIEAFVKDGSDFGVRVRYCYDGDKLLGTGGAVLKAASNAAAPFFVMYGDSLLTVDFAGVARAYEESGKMGLMTVYRNNDLWDNSNVVFADGMVRAYSKKTRVPEMDCIDYGLGVLSLVAFGGRKPGDVFDLADIYEGLADRGELAGYEAAVRFYEIGSREGLSELDEILSKRDK